MKNLILISILTIGLVSCKAYDKTKPHTFDPRTKYNKKGEVRHPKTECPAYDRAHQVKHDKYYDLCPKREKVKYKKTKIKKWKELI